MENITLIGIVVQTVLFLLGGYAMVIRNDGSNQNLREDVKGIEKELKKLSEVITGQAVQTTRIDNLAAQVTMLYRNLEELRHGNGFVKGSSGIDREFP